MMIRIEDDALLFIEPQGRSADVPIEDDLTKRMRKALEKSSVAKRYRGWHTCVCGKHSDNADRYVVAINGRKLLTNSLATHYLSHHRDEVPETELAKVRLLP